MSISHIGTTLRVLKLLLASCFMTKSNEKGQIFERIKAIQFPPKFQTEAR